MNCRFCNTELSLELIDLGIMPLSNAYLSEADLAKPEKKYPLRVLVCEKCWLVQTEDFAGRDEIFQDDYAYFSSYSTTWLKHAKKYVDDMVKRLGLNEGSQVVEVAANDGYLLQYFQVKNIPCYGIEPTASTAEAARHKGLDIVQSFFGEQLARELAVKRGKADLIVANNVLAHVPDIKDFVAGIRELLNPDGVATLEFPHLCKLIEGVQFDTIYHEHYSYLSLTAVSAIFRYAGLEIFDLEELSTHGGSLRIYVRNSGKMNNAISFKVTDLLQREADLGIKTADYCKGFAHKVDAIRAGFREFLLKEKSLGHKVAAYGAAAKGNTLLNYSNVDVNLIEYVVDRNPEKQGKYLPGSHIPIVSEPKLKEDHPACVIVLPWNIMPEVTEQLLYIKKWGGYLAVAIPEMKIYEQ